MLPGRNPADLYAWQGETRGNLGPELSPMIDALHAIADEITQADGRAMPEASLIQN